MQHLPTVLLTFADANGDLSGLKEESSALKDAFLLLEHEGLIRLEREESVTADELRKRLETYLSSLIVFHYAGHANGASLLFEQGKGNAKGLADMLAQAQHLHVVFLNGCETAAQAQYLLELGVPVVIATARVIPDHLAMKFATVFYEAISRKETVQTAFAFAEGFLAMRYDLSTEVDSPSLSWEDETDQDEEPLYWRIFGSEQAQTWRIDLEAKTWLNLRQGSKQHLTELLRRPLRHHRKLIEKTEDGREPPVHVRVQTDAGHDLPFPAAVDWLASQEGNRHAWLTGEPGSGRTGSIIKLWHEWVHQPADAPPRPVPIFIDLEEWQEEHQLAPRQDGLVDYIARYYLELEGLSEERETDMIIRLMEQEPPNERPRLLLLLDGQQPHARLQAEIRKLAAYPNVQIIYTTHEIDPEDRDTVRISQTGQALGFQYLHILPLDVESLHERLDWEKARQYRPEVRHLLTNLSWLNCFFTFYDKIESGDPWQYIRDFSTEAEMLWNSLEGQLQDSVIDPETHPERLAFQRFYIRHFLPYLAFLMESNSIPEWEADDLLETINRISADFYQRRFLKVFPVYRRHLHHLRLRADNWVKEEERFAIVTELGREFGIFTESRKSQWLNSFIRNYRHLQQRTTYTIGNPVLLHFLSALHIRNDIQTALTHGEWPETLRERLLPVSVRRMLGQLEGVSKQKTQSALLRLLDRCRGAFDQKVIGYTVQNLLSIWQDLNGYYIGLSLARLDLRGVPLNILARELSYQPYYLSTDLTGALIDWNDILTHQPSYIMCGGYSPSGNSFIGGETDGTLRQWDIELGICYQIIDAHDAPIHAVCQTSDGQFFFTASADGTVKVWDRHAEHCLLQISISEQQPQAVFTLRCQPVPHTPGQWYLVTGSRYRGEHDPNLRLWNVTIEPGNRESTLLMDLVGHRDDIRAVDFYVEDSEQLRILSGSWDGTVRYWEIDLKQRDVQSLVQRQHVSRVHRVAFSPDRRYAASASSDDTIILWDLAQPDRQRIRRLRGHIRSVNAIRFWQHPENNQLWLISGGSDQRVMLWQVDAAWTSDKSTIDYLDLPVEIAHGTWEREAHQDFARITEVDVAPDGTHIAFATDQGHVHVMKWGRGGEFHDAHILDTNYELHVQGCQFIDLHEESNGGEFPRYQALLRQYGAIFNETDAQNWDLIVSRLRRSLEE